MYAIFIYEYSLIIYSYHIGYHIKSNPDLIENYRLTNGSGITVFSKKGRIKQTSALQNGIYIT